MRLTSPARIEAWDRRKAAVHEAGHVVVARHLGMYASHAILWKNQRPAADDKLWLGRAFIGPRMESLAPDQVRMIAVAGAVAEEVWSHGTMDCPEDFFMWPEAMSAADWAMAGYEPGCLDDGGLDAVEHVAVLLTPGGELWPRLVEEARRLIECAVVEEAQPAAV